MQSGWVWQGYVEVSRHGVCVFTQGLLLFLGDCPWVGSQECTRSSVSPILLSPSGSWNKLEQVVVVNLCLGNSVTWKCSLVLTSHTFGNGNRRAWDQPNFLQDLLLLQCLVIPCYHDCMLGKVWGNMLIPVVCLESSLVCSQWTGEDVPYKCDSGALICPRSNTLSRAFVALMLEAFTPTHWWSEWISILTRQESPWFNADSLTFR